MILLVYTVDSAGVINVIAPECSVPNNKGYIDLFLSLFNLLDGKKICTVDNISGKYKLNILLHIAKDFKKPATEFDHYNFGQDYFLHTKENYSPIIHFCKVTFSDRSKIQNRYAAIMDNSIWNTFILYNRDEKNHLIINESFLIKKISYVTNILHKGIYNLSAAKEYAELNARITQESYLKEFSRGIGHSSYVSPFVFHSESEVEQLIEHEFFSDSSNKSIVNISNQRWRILLIDDKANHAMAPYQTEDYDEMDETRWDSKLKIVKFWINSVFDKINKPKDFVVAVRRFCFTDEYTTCSSANLLIEYVENMHDADMALKNKKYDLILLDYLMLSNNNDGPTNYGYELLEDIYNYVISKKLIKSISNEIKNSVTFESIFNKISCSIKYEELWKYIDSKQDLKSTYKDVANFNGSNEEIEKKWRDFYESIVKYINKDEYKIGPQKRLFFMFISAYSSAVHDRLLAQGINQSEEYWFINMGACPTNTPQLFLYNLLKLMEKRLDDSGILKLSSVEIYSLINKIYLPKEQDSMGDSVRKRANALYQKVLSLQYHYRSILKDVEIPFGQNTSIFNTRGSVLMTDFIQKKTNLGGMLEHLTQLVHLTAFGTIRQWPEMWEEYIYFKAQFEKQIVEENDFDSVVPAKLKEMFLNIEKYILELKSQQQ